MVAIHGRGQHLASNVWHKVLTKPVPIHQSSTSNLKCARRRDLYRKKTAAYAMARKTKVGATISVVLLSRMCALQYASSDSCASAMALLEVFLEVAMIIFANRDPEFDK